MHEGEGCVSIFLTIRYLSPGALRLAPKESHDYP